MHLLLLLLLLLLPLRIALHMPRRSVD